MIALPPWVMFLVVVLAAAAGTAFALNRRRSMPDLCIENALRRMPLPFAAACLPTLVIIGTVFADDARLWLWHLPYAVHYWAIGIVWSYFAALLTFIGAFAMTLACVTGHRQVRQLALANAILLIAILLPQWTFTRPLADQIGHEIGPDGAILQSTGASCAAASGANIARLLGISDADEKRVATAMGTTRLGTMMPQAVEGMKVLGIICTPAAVPADIDSLPTPAFLFIDHPAVGRNGHAIVLTGRDPQGSYRIIDPLVGKLTWNRGTLIKVWHGLAVSCASAR